MAALTAGAVLSVAAGGAAVADDLWNTLDGTSAGAATLDAQAEAVPLTIG